MILERIAVPEFNGDEPSCAQIVQAEPIALRRGAVPHGKNANELTSQSLTDIGRAPTFYDVRVELERAR